jgi:type IX secretion system PorP/SprF family membrane protein
MVTCLFMVTSMVVARAQDPVFSQFYNAPAYLNPALIGDEDDMTLNMSYRNQWKSIHSEYMTTQASFIYPFYNTIHKYPFSHIGGMGISLYNDVSGVNKSFKNLGANVSFAYNLQLTSSHVNRLSFGLQMGLINKRTDTQSFQWGSQFDPNSGYNSDGTGADDLAFHSKTFLDITPGVFYRFYNRKHTARIQSVYSGFSVGHVNNPEQSIIDGHKEALPLLYKYHGGIIFGLTRQASVSFNALTLLQDTKMQGNLGAFFSYQITESLDNRVFSNIVARIGGWHRINDSFILSTEFLANSFEFGFSYDWNLTSLNRFSSGVGAYEFSMKYNLSRHAPPKVNY